MITKKTWTEFRKTGFVLIVNQILHLFGWAIVFELDAEGDISEVYPARVKFRGFDSESVAEAYCKATDFLKENIEDLHEEARL